ncbi:hypothetical protein [Bradyrhizobium agreste]|uniref:hypothetical protein n=1 Tax=Bradyrhizobium agreste TaxID=2751811 RepID=UPI001FE788C2|nr:hypothetical protein [Bradyrhizobium agreste]
MKKPAADCIPRGPTQTRFDDAILPVFCPTCQTNEFAQAALDNQERPAMTIKTPSHGTSPSDTSRNRPGSKPASTKNAPRSKRPKTADEPADDDRDLAHGEGGTIDLPTRPGDMSKDD